MNDVIIVGDGPGGLSAALFLAKAGKSVVVFGEDNTAMHAAMLYNYLGLQEMSGSAFQRVARSQVARFGATLRDERVEAVVATDGGFEATTAGGDKVSGKVLLLSEGKGARLAKSLGAETTDGGAIATNNDGLSSVANVYVVGRSVRPGRSQAIISAGDGAAAAIDILSREKGEAFCDWDVPPEA